MSALPLGRWPVLSAVRKIGRRAAHRARSTCQLPSERSELAARAGEVITAPEADLLDLAQRYVAEARLVVARQLTRPRSGTTACRRHNRSGHADGDGGSSKYFQSSSASAGKPRQRSLVRSTRPCAAEVAAAR